MKRQFCSALFCNQLCSISNLKFIYFGNYLILVSLLTISLQITHYFSSFTMQEDITEKQSFLYKQIIQAGYNPESFQQFIVTENPQKGMDLQQWTMPELKTITNKFKNQQSDNQNKAEQKKGEIAEQAQEADYSMSPGKKGQINDMTSKQEDYYKVVQCMKSKAKPIDINSVIVIDNFEKREGGMFEKSYVVYQIKVDTLKSCVMRRYTDFESFRQGLQIMYLGLPIPPLAKKGKMKRKDQKHLTKRMYILEKFLNKLLVIPEIRACEMFQKFLTAKDSKQFYDQISRLKKAKLIPLEKMETIQGKVEFKIDANLNSFIAKTHKFLSVSQPDVKKIYKDFKGAATSLEACAENFKSIEKNCSILNQNWIKLTKQCDLPRKKDNMFSFLASMSNRYADVLIQQAKLFRKQVYSILKYQSFSMINYIQSLDKLSQLQQTYLDHKSGLLKKKQKLYDEGILSKWGTIQKITTKPNKQQAFAIMLPKQTRQILRQRDNYALFNYQIYKELQRNWRQNDKVLCRYFEEVLKKESEISSKGIMIWADLMIANRDMTVQVST